MLTGCHKPPTESDIELLKKELGCHLSANFLRFWSENNGGFPRKRNYHSLKKTIYVQYIYPIAEEVFPNVRQQTTRFVLPDFFACVGRIGQGDILLLNCKSDEIYILVAGNIEYLTKDIWDFVGNLEGEESPQDDIVKQIGSSSNIEWLKSYVAEGNSINSISASGTPLLQIAALQEDIKMVKECIRLGANIEGLKECLEKVAMFDFLMLLQNEGVLPSKRGEKKGAVNKS